jgi:predicted transglutaminase-like cysteine proteinase
MQTALARIGRNAARARNWLASAAAILVLVGLGSAAQANPLGLSRALKPQVERLAFAGPALTPLGLTRFCLSNPDQCNVTRPVFRPARTTFTTEKRRELDEVNRQVNRAIRPRADAPGLINDIWTIGPSAGDCDDYAVTKRAELIRRGWSPRSLLLAEVVAPTGEDHLVLVARTRGGDFVLDNLATQVLPVGRANLRFVAIQSPAHPQMWRVATLRAS